MSEENTKLEQENVPSDETEKSEPQSTHSAGKILAQARKNLGIELADLAEQTRVPLNVLEAIEIDKVPKNLPDTFIRGYIRSYARKVGVEESLVLPKVETLAAASEPVKKMQSFSRRNKKKAFERRLTIFSWFMVLVVIIAVMTWSYQSSDNTDFAPLANTEQPVVFATQESKVQAIEELPPEQNTLTQDQQTQTEESSKTNTNENTATDSEQPVKLTAAQQALVADNGEPDEAGFMKVEMQFENECWVEVYDVTGDRVAVGNKPSGYMMTLNAQGPLNVLLGNPVGVSIWVNGKIFDTSNLAKNRVARFELEAN